MRRRNQIKPATHNSKYTVEIFEDGIQSGGQKKVLQALHATGRVSRRMNWKRSNIVRLVIST
jgi:hypothetical protein